MFHENRTRTAGILGMLGAVLFFIGLLIEYRFGLFPPGSGTLYVLNQVQFLVAMSGILVDVVGYENGAGRGRRPFRAHRPHPLPHCLGDADFGHHYQLDQRQCRITSCSRWED